MTVFIRITSTDGSGGLPYINQSFLDSAILARTPTVSASSPAFSQTSSFTVRWDNAVAAPGGYVRWYDAQWMDEADGIWHDWFYRTSATQAVFAMGQPGHTYRFRARAWQHYQNGAHLWGPYEPQAGSRTYVRGPSLAGHVLSNEGRPMSGATVSIEGTAYADVTDHRGYYAIYPPPLSGPQVAAVSHPVWLAPPPVGSLSLGSTEQVELTWSLGPPDDAVVNGDFEAELEGWAVSGNGEVQAGAAPEAAHTGAGGLALGGRPDEATVTSVSQAAPLARSWEPALSFWYRSEGDDAGDRFRVTVTLPTGAGGAADVLQAYDLPLGQAAWRQWTALPLPEAYFTGTVTLALELENDADAVPATVYVDEIRWGRTVGGPYRFYLPMVGR
jgi:hypothetical protein